MECFASLPSRKLLPIFTYPEKYVYQAVPLQDNYPVETKRSTFVSGGRLTPECIYTQFSGPLIGSTQLATISPGNEAIFAKLFNYTYLISWELNGNTAKLWTVDVDQELVFEMYSVSGRVAEFHKRTGKIEVYGFNFPLVVELPMGASLTMEMTLGRFLSNDINPLFPGHHCLLRKPSLSSDHHCLLRKPSLSSDHHCFSKEIVYENVVDSSVPGISSIVRVVSEKYQDINTIIRSRHYRNFREPCVGIVPAFITTALVEPEVFTVDPLKTVDTYSVLFAQIINYNTPHTEAIVRSVAQDLCAQPFYLFFPVRSSAIFQYAPTQSTIGLLTKFLIPYAKSVIRFDFDVTLTYTTVINNAPFGCSSVPSNPRYLGIHLADGTILSRIDGTPAQIPQVIPFTSSSDLLFRGSMDVVVFNGSAIYFGGNQTYLVGPLIPNAIIYPPKFTQGTITCTVIQ